MTQKIRHSYSFNFSDHTRYLILILCILAVSFIVSNAIALNFTLICMTGEVDYTAKQKGWLLSIVAVGQTLGVLSLPYCIAHFQVRSTFTAYGLISAVATLLSPFSAYYSYWMLLAMRFLQGFAMSTQFTGMGAITSKWAPLRESGMFVALLSSSLQLGSMFTMPVAGLLCDSSWGWPSLYYLLGGITLISFVLFYMIYKDEPYRHKFVSDKELKQIQEGKVHNFDGDKIQSKSLKVPYKEILTDKCVWGIITVNIGMQMGFRLFGQYGPTYLNKVLKFDIKSTGVSTALPFVAAFLVKWIAGPLSDRIKCVSTRTNILIFNISACLLIGLGTLSLAFIPAGYPYIAQMALIISQGFGVINVVGSFKSAQLISQHFSFVLMNLINLASSAIVFVLPLIVSFLTPNNTLEEWRVIFIGISVSIFIGMIIFNLTFEVEPRSWVRSSKDSSSSTLTNSEKV